ncbi:DUF4229 domain-containing protein [Paeniglutamicibacter gangotriensis]|uniref:DUF4229 domain-containing protein n=1 Tax=Paeniglutamicibacter gangotriensis Lz1y TaxID=1276920 RepID=M7NAU4_9MICC|nr:DUF4229 domain-containing protein [Paeniglutamicibacter gangotriensis]EMQ98919.1 hypothetical protein ADIAG_01678 [Paeniglutamicibacter gangotriensis Lz1y]
MQFFKYTVIRLAIFFVIFLPLVFLLQWPLYTAGLIALVIAFALSYLFLNKMRLAANADVQKMFDSRGPKKSKHDLEDEAAEDRFLDDDK